MYEILGKAVAGFLVVIFVVAVAASILSLPTMWLWNWLCPVIFGLPKIGFWQALGLCFLARCIIPTSTSK